MADAVDIDGFKLYKKNDSTDEFLTNLDKTARSYDVQRTMAAGVYGISAYKTVTDVTDPSKSTVIESTKKYFTVNPFYKVTIVNTVEDSDKVTVTWTNETNANYFTGYYILRVTTSTEGTKSYETIATLEKTATTYTFTRDDDTAYTYVISPITYEDYHNADSDAIEVIVVTIPPVMLTTPVDAVTYTANWLYDGDTGYSNT